MIAGDADGALCAGAGVGLALAGSADAGGRGAVEGAAAGGDDADCCGDGSGFQEPTESAVRAPLSGTGGGGAGAGAAMSPGRFGSHSEMFTGGADGGRLAPGLGSR